MNFSIGDRVICVVDHPEGNRELFRGSMGTVCKFGGYQVGVSWDTMTNEGHNLGGSCEEGHGWFVHPDELILYEPSRWDHAPEIGEMVRATIDHPAGNASLMTGDIGVIQSIDAPSIKVRWDKNIGFDDDHEWWVLAKEITPYIPESGDDIDYEFNEDSFRSMLFGASKGAAK